MNSALLIPYAITPGCNRVAQKRSAWPGGSGNFAAQFFTLFSMNRIRVLPDQVANQIAAGEVVERPASVVKELVENAIDAGAGKIGVEIQAGGRALIRVTDDGVGMSRDDAMLSLERHGTSKLRKAEDLTTIETMGFRGEAVPSIASVCRFTLTTRERDSDEPEGTEVAIDGGKLIDVKSAGRAPGTTVEARQLFFNLPARRKFLKSQETERAHIQHCLALTALAHPQIAFDFKSDKRMVWRLPAESAGGDAASRMAALKERLRALYGAEIQMIPVEGEEGRVRIWGFTGAPGVSRANRQDQHVFVNKRPIEHRGLNQALLEGYRGGLPKARYPICCLFLEMPTASVDVNIHPAKREVKFERDREVRALVADAVRDALLDFHRESLSTSAADDAVDAVPADEALQAEPFPIASTKRGETMELAGGESFEAATPAATPEPERKSGAISAQRIFPEVPKPTPVPPATSTSSGKQAGNKPGRAPLDEAARERIAAIEKEVKDAPLEPAPLLKVPLRMLGTVARHYVVLESDRGMVLMDRRAAHERVLYEKMLAEAQDAAGEAQRLLLPETVELSARDAGFVREQLDALAKLGVGLSEFGEQTFLLDALPPFVRGMDARKFVLELIDDLKAAGSSAGTDRLTERAIAQSLCHRAVQSGDSLSETELTQLVEDLRRCSMPYTCPNGRPTLIEMNERELAKKFGRGM